MKRLLKSSNFWNAVIGSAIAIYSYHLTKSDGLSLAIIGIFTARAAATGINDYAKTNNGIVYNPQTKQEEKL